MKLTTAFRISTYLCLALATACLGYAVKQPMYLPGAEPIYAFLGLLILLAFLLEEHWSMPGYLANLVAIGILLGWVSWFWMDLRALRNSDVLALDHTLWALPRMAPLLGILLLAKLFRPKQAGDHWLLHVLALVQVTLACALARWSRLDREDPVFAVLILSYAAAGVWAIMLFYLHRETTAGRTLRGKPVRVHATGLPLPWHLQGLRQTAGWIIVAALLAVPLFLLIPWPAQGGGPSQVLTTSSSTGFSPVVDLNDTGPLEVTADVVMRVEAANRFGHLVKLGEHQRWRGVSCSAYRNGRWRSITVADHYIRNSPLVPPLENLKPNQLRLKFELDLSKVNTRESAEMGEMRIFLAEPIYHLVYDEEGLARFPWVHAPELRANVRDLGYRLEETALYTRLAPQRGPMAYTQIIEYQTDARRDQWSDPAFLRRSFVSELQALDETMKEVLRQKAEEILRLERVGLNADVQEKARALERYLSHSAEYSYSLDRRRQDRSLDPTLDFLLNVKQGHCELFASALALMLRSLDIPARVVIGFRGCEYVSYPLLPAVNEVRQYHAHAWVEALLDRKPRTITVQGSRQIDFIEGRWLTLDPTPGTGTSGLVAEAHQLTWQERLGFVKYFWSFLLDYNGNVQGDRFYAMDSMFRQQLEFGGPHREVSSIGVLLFLTVGFIVALLAASLMFTWIRRRKGRFLGRLISVPFYLRLLRLLERLSLRPSAWQTPREFGATAGDALRAKEQTVHVAEVPAKVVVDFYHVRFGGRTLDASQNGAVQHALDRLEKSL